MDRVASSWATSTSGRIDSCIYKCQQQKHARSSVGSQLTARRIATAAKQGMVCRGRPIRSVHHDTAVGSMIFITWLSWSRFAAFSEGVKAYGKLWVPDETGQIPLITAGQAPAAANYSSSPDDHKARTPPPDLPSLLLDSRIVFLGMPVSSLQQAQSLVSTAGQCLYLCLCP